MHQRIQIKRAYAPYDNMNLATLIMEHQIPKKSSSWSSPRFSKFAPLIIKEGAKY